MTGIIFQKAHYLMGAAKLSQVLPDVGKEVAFAGRSNAGKSSALNVLTQQKQLARTSKTPGRTQLINFFGLAEPERRLVDLPGYGYAKVSLQIKQNWQKTLGEYLQKRESLQGLILLMDSRHPLTEYDCAMLDWCYESDLPCHILLTKSDKLKQQGRLKVLRAVQAQIAEAPLFSVQLFSSLKRQGVQELEAVLNHWLA